MGFEHIAGQVTAVETLTRALGASLLHHAYRFEGPAGVGKELTAFALAQALLCEDLLGCGACDSCRRVRERAETAPIVPLHPDVVLLGRGVYPPDLLGGKNETSEISVEQIRRLVLAQAGYPPHEGRARVFIIRDAEELSTSAANALLKTLEEPRPDTYFILLTSQPDKLLSTIRSRSLPVRFGPLPDGVLENILQERGIAKESIPLLVTLSGGSAGAALEATDEELVSRRQAFIEQMGRAVAEPDLLAAVELGESLPKDRHAVIDDLNALAMSYVRQARAQVATEPAAAEWSARQHALVLDAIEAVRRNAAADLAITSLVASLRRAWPCQP